MVIARRLPVPYHPALLLPTARRLTRERPVTNVFYPKWSLRIVLNYLAKSLFEHISKCSLENLKLKTVFLVALASGRHRSEIHALSISDECFRFAPNLTQVSLLTEPGFLSKTPKPGKAPAKIVIKSLAHHVSKDLPDCTLCPVRAQTKIKRRVMKPGRTGQGSFFRSWTPSMISVWPTSPFGLWTW